MKKFFSNVYIKNAIFTFIGLIAILIAKLVTAIPPLVAAYIVFIALLFIARGTGKIINTLAITAWKNKKSDPTISPARDETVRNKSVTLTLIIVLCLLAVVALKPNLFGNPGNALIFFCAVFFWHIINIPIYIYFDKNYVMKIGK